MAASLSGPHYTSEHWRTPVSFCGYGLSCSFDHTRHYQNTKTSQTWGMQAGIPASGEICHFFLFPAPSLPPAAGADGWVAPAWPSCRHIASLGLAYSTVGLPRPVCSSQTLGMLSFGGGRCPATLISWCLHTADSLRSETTCYWG